MSAKKQLIMAFSFLALAMVALIPFNQTKAAYLNNASSAQTSSGLGTSDLGELIVLSNLFSGQSGSSVGGMNLGELIALDSLFNDGTTGTSRNTVTVERGDTLSGISQRFLGNAGRYNEIANLNNLSNPNLIYPGQQLRLPANGGTTGTQNDLSELIILQGLFGGNNGGTSDLGQLMILDRLFDN